MRAIFVTWDGGGNETTAFAVADELRDRGHDILILAYESQRERISARGLEFDPLLRASSEFAQHPSPIATPAVVMASEAQLRDVGDAIAEGRGDVVIVDCLMFGALTAVEAAGTPTVVLIHSPAGCLVPRGGLLDGVLLGDVNELRASAGLREVRTLRSTWQTGSTLATTIREMDPEPFEAATYVGRIVARSHTVTWKPPWHEGDRRPLVVASFTTGGAWDQRSRMRRAIHALAEAPVRVLVSTAGVELEGGDTPSNVALTPFIPHDVVLPGAAVLITHAGHGSVLASLAYGIPLVCLPNPLSDQPGVAARVVELGAGRALDGETSTARQLREAVEDVMADPSYARSAKRLQRIIRAGSGVAGAADAVEEVARNSRAS